MRQRLILLVLSLAAVAIYACGGAAVPANTSSGDTCPLLDPGPPPLCPQGCQWDEATKQCLQTQGIIMEGSKADAGTPK